jgi:hypothetical protein
MPEGVLSTRSGNTPAAALRKPERSHSQDVHEKFNMLTFESTEGVYFRSRRIEASMRCGGRRIDRAATELRW